MTKTDRIILELVRKALCADYKVEEAVFTNAPWTDVIEKATEQGVLGVCFDALEKLKDESGESKDRGTSTELCQPCCR